MAVKDFAFDTGKIFQLPVGAEAFGNNGSITSHSSREHYEKAQSLMRDVLKMAHERGIRMAMGFEFGVIPPEYFSLNVAGDCFYWAGEMCIRDRIHSPPLPNRFISWMVFLLPVVECREQAKTV